MARSFTAQLGGACDKRKRWAREIFNESVQDVVDIIQTPVAKGGNMPVDTGNLRNSLATELNGSELAQGEDTYSLAIAQADVGDTLRFTWDPTRVGATANYAAAVEFGTRGRPGRHFVGQAAARWPQIVEANARRVR